MKKSRKEDVLKTANCIIRKVGYSNLSFSQIAISLNITRENVHHYFKKKELLGNACLELMIYDLENKFTEILNGKISSRQKLQNYFKIYKTHQNDREDCPIVSLLAEFELLPNSMQKQIKELIEIEQKNIEIILKEGYKNNTFNLNKSVEEEAFMLISLLKGAVSYSKIYNNFKKTTMLLLESLEK